jgi:hypothetical protein
MMVSRGILGTQSEVTRFLAEIMEKIAPGVRLPSLVFSIPSIPTMVQRLTSDSSTEHGRQQVHSGDASAKARRAGH